MKVKSMYCCVNRNCLVVMVATLLMGCGPSGPKTYSVSGTVSLDNQPLETGKIFLIDPAGRLDSDVGDIADGKFKFRAKPGSKRVELRAERQTGEISHFGGAVTAEALPARYNSQSTLTEEVTTNAKENVYTFELQSQ
ncbi:MAG: hypothetical protein MK179_08070 [Pirellulaceae bacterium]|nr:hypothetical protein [Pirellulaceae bacterium]